MSCFFREMGGIRNVMFFPYLIRSLGKRYGWSDKTIYLSMAKKYDKTFSKFISKLAGLYFLYGGTIILYGEWSRPALVYMVFSIEKSTEDSLEFWIENSTENPPQPPSLLIPYLDKNKILWYNIMGWGKKPPNPPALNASIITRPHPSIILLLDSYLPPCVK